MPWLRHKRWAYATPLAPAVTVCQSGRVYRCTGVEEGVVDVPYESDINELLNPQGDRGSEWEVAWERYGVIFNGQGKVVVAVTEPVVVAAGASKSTVRASAPAPQVKRGPGRPKRS